MPLKEKTFTKGAESASQVEEKEKGKYNPNKEQE